MRALSLRVAPLEGESLPGFTVRLARHAALRGPKELALLAGMRHPTATVANDNLEGLSALSKVPVPDLVAMSNRALPGKARRHRFLEGAIQSDLLTMGRRACVECLRESAHHRAAWMLAVAPACVRHNTRLVEACPSCGATLSWRDPEVIRCRNGCDLRRVRPTDAGETESGVSELALELAARGRPPWVHSDFGPIDGSDTLKLVIELGFISLERGRNRRVGALMRLPPGEVASLMLEGGRILKRWPEDLDRLLAGRPAALLVTGKSAASAPLFRAARLARGGNRKAS